jgi:hypothetical protein
MRNRGISQNVPVTPFMFLVFDFFVSGDSIFFDLFVFASFDFLFHLQVEHPEMCMKNNFSNFNHGVLGTVDWLFLPKSRNVVVTEHVFTS